jgi:hypothetical protein
MTPKPKETTGTKANNAIGIVASILGIIVAVIALVPLINSKLTQPSAKTAISIVQSSPTPIPTLTPTLPKPTSTLSAIATTGCPQTFYTGAGVLKNVAMVVPDGCVVVGSGFSGSLGPYTWGGTSPGAVFALQAGSYSGFIKDGDYFVRTSDQGPSTFCSLVKQLPNVAHQWPLPGWPSC